MSNQQSGFTQIYHNIHSEQKSYYFDRCVRAPVDFEEIPLSNQVNNEEMLEKAILSVKRNGIALKGKTIVFFFDKEVKLSFCITFVSLPRKHRFEKR